MHFGITFGACTIASVSYTGACTNMWGNTVITSFRDRSKFMGHLSRDCRDCYQWKDFCSRRKWGRRIFEKLWRRRHFYCKTSKSKISFLRTKAISGVKKYWRRYPTNFDWSLSKEWNKNKCNPPFHVDPWVHLGNWPRLLRLLFVDPRFVHNLQVLTASLYFSSWQHYYPALCSYNAN